MYSKFDFEKFEQSKSFATKQDVNRIKVDIADLKEKTFEMNKTIKAIGWLISAYIILDVFFKYMKSMS